MKAITVHGLPVAGGTHPLICTPLVGRTREALLGELAIVVAKRPDLIEWRVDFFAEIGDTMQVIDVATHIRAAAGGTPIIFTCRTLAEGGEAIALDATDVTKLYVAACASGCVDLIDYELSNSSENLARLRNVSRDNDVLLILSYHNVTGTPDPELLMAKFLDAERLGADVAKVAVLASRPEDVLTLLASTLRGCEACAIPLIALSLGEVGSLSRMVAWIYGSAVTFAAGHHASAPGQPSIEDLRVTLNSLQHGYCARAAPGPSAAIAAPG